MLIWEMPSENVFFCYSAWIMGTLKVSTHCFLISVPKIKTLRGGGVRMDPIYPNRLISSQISVNKKS